MDSALRPREIQARIRAGESLEEVARLSGASADRIERFATPVLAEREYVTGVALTSSVRRWGELSGHRNLGVVAGERFLAHGIDPETVSW
ncbi:MAG: septation protein SepH, partial [Propionibacteriaceae bacterium]|nr:septation protein SepH [Propionibacteriaceae bacterium]